MTTTEIYSPRIVQRTIRRLIMTSIHMSITLTAPKRLRYKRREAAIMLS